MITNSFSIVDSYLDLFSDKLKHLLDDVDKKKIFYHLSHQEEKEITHRDQWGNWDFPFTNFDYRQPYLDFFVQGNMQSLGLKQKRLWPDGKRFAFCITHDLDHVGLNRLQESQRVRTRKMSNTVHRTFSNLFNLTTKITGNHKLWCYEKWIDFLELVDYKSTFFIYSNPSDVRKQHLYDNLYEFDDIIKFRGKEISVAEFVKIIDGRGFEVGMHGSYFSASDSAIFAEEKKKIENILGKKIFVTRQHFLRYDITTTPSVHSSNSILVDSTLGFNRTIGFRAGTCMPYFMHTATGEKVLEVPMHIMDGALFTTNALELDESLAIKKSLQLMDYCERAGGVMTINFHPNYVIYDKWWNVFKAIVTEAKNRNAYNTTLMGIHNIFQRSTEKELQK